MLTAHYGPSRALKNYINDIFGSLQKESGNFLSEVLHFPQRKVALAYVHINLF